MTHGPAYPPADTVVLDYLLRAPGTNQELLCKVYLRSFLTSLFASAHLQAKEFFPPNTIISYADMAKKFYDFFKDMSQRNTFTTVSLRMPLAVL